MILYLYLLLKKLLHFPPNFLKSLPYLSNLHKIKPMAGLKYARSCLLADSRTPPLMSFFPPDESGVPGDEEN